MFVNSIPDDICYICFEALEAYLKKTGAHPIYDRLKPKLKDLKFPLFVTWHKRSHLRGCVGCFDPLQLPDGVKNYAVIAGTEDSRFPAITVSELQDLTVCVSLLANFAEAQDCFDWEVGKHGIRLYIAGRTATFLPEVAVEQGWDKITTLKNLARKSGYPMDFGGDALRKATVERYESFKFTKSWDDYVRYKAEFS